MSDIELKALREHANEVMGDEKHWPAEDLIGPRDLIALLDRLEAAEKERNDQRIAITAIVHASGGKVLVGPATLKELRSLTLTRHEYPDTFETVFEVAAMAQEGGK